MKKLFVLLIKYMPTIQLVGMLVNNTLYKYDVNLEFDYIGDFLLGNSIANITILYVCSYTFGFCKWHRYIIMANLVNVIIATIDKVFVIPITDMELLCSYYVIAGIFIIIQQLTFGLKMKMLVLVKYGIISKKFKEVFILKVKR